MGADSDWNQPPFVYGHETPTPASYSPSVASGGLREVHQNTGPPYCLSMPLHIPTKSGKVLRVVATLMTSISGIRSPSIAANVAIR